MDPLKDLKKHWRWLCGGLLVEGGFLSLAFVVASALWKGVFVTLAALLTLLALLAAALHFHKKWKARGSREQIKRAMTPNPLGFEELTDEEGRRKVEQLRIPIAEGLRKLDERDIDYSELPWYLVIGAPAAGKTVACHALTKRLGNVRGMNKPYGDDNIPGTKNLEYWFYKQAIFLDTAGRLAFQETPEWDELMAQLKRIRPDCPINGVILVIGADELGAGGELKLTADDLALRAERLAEQLNSAKLKLGVRFPVYVLVTKADLIDGFREFFSPMKEQENRDQIIGWSTQQKDPGVSIDWGATGTPPAPGRNPAASPQPDLGAAIPLASAWNPAESPQPEAEEDVEYITEILSVLHRWRLSLVGQQEGEQTVSQRLESLQRSYLFPSKLREHLRNLNIYIRTILGEHLDEGVYIEHLTKRPLFLRGIYLSSSKQVGEVAVEEDDDDDKGQDRPKGVESERRIYFLKDLVLKKIFPEKRLVTAEDSLGDAKRKQHLAIATAVAGVLFFVALFAVLLRGGIKSGIGDEKALWETATGVSANNRSELLEDIRQNDPVFDGFSLVDLHTNLMNRAEKSLKVPAVFWPVKLLPFGNIDVARRTAARILFEKQLLKPILEETREKLRQPPGPNLSGSDIARLRAVLQSLLRLEADIENKSGSVDGGRLLLTNCLMYLNFPREPMTGKITYLFESTYREKYSQHLPWPNPGFREGVGGLSDHPAIQAGLENFVKTIGEANRTTEITFGRLQNTETNLKQFRDAERNLYSTVGSDSLAWEPLQASHDRLNAGFAADNTLVPLLSNGLFNLDGGAYQLIYQKAIETSQASLKGFQDSVPREGKIAGEVADRLRQAGKMATGTVTPPRAPSIADTELDQGWVLPMNSGKPVYEGRWNLLADLRNRTNVFALGDGFTNYIQWHTNLVATAIPSAANIFNEMSNYVCGTWTKGITQRWQREYAGKVDSSFKNLKDVAEGFAATDASGVALTARWRQFQESLSSLSRLQEDLLAWPAHENVFILVQNKSLKDWKEQLRVSSPGNAVAASVQSAIGALSYGLKNLQFPLGAQDRQPASEQFIKDHLAFMAQLQSDMVGVSNIVIRLDASGAITSLAQRVSALGPIQQFLRGTNGALRTCSLKFIDEGTNSIIKEYDNIGLQNVLVTAEPTWSYIRTGTRSMLASNLPLAAPLRIQAAKEAQGKTVTKQLADYPAWGLLRLVREATLIKQGSEWKAVLTREGRQWTFMLDFGEVVPLDAWQQGVKP